jgi:release factor glutamine methyltransferase
MLELAQAPRSAAHVLQQRAPERWLGALAGKLLELSYRVSGKARYDDYRLERVLGTPLLVTPSVFNPKIPRSGAFLASRIATLRLPAGVDVLDMGTGSGVCALVAARSVRRVVAVDINAAAVRCAQLNALLNRLEHRVDVRHGDLYEPLTGERFDLVLFNPPFLRGTPRDDRDRAWRSRDVVERFAAGLAAHLNPQGYALVVLSSFGEAEFFLEQFAHSGLAISIDAERRYINERLAIFRLKPWTEGTRA